VRREYRAAAGVPGVALGALRRVDRPVDLDAPVTIPLLDAFDQVSADLGERAEVLRRDGQAAAAEITAAVQLIAEDPDLRGAVEAAVHAGIPVLEAVSGAIDRYALLLADLPDLVLAARAADVRAVGRRLLAALTAAPPLTVDGPCVLVGEEVAADDVLSATGTAAAVASVVGGGGSHTAIVARALGIPAVFGVDPALLGTPDGAPVLIDGAAGRVVVEPDEDERAAHDTRVRERDQRRAELAAQRDQETTTRDGHRVPIYANVGWPADNRLARELGAAGIGLVRTELPFLTATRWPDFDEHRAALAPLLDGFADRPVTVRTLDFADDKLPPFLRAGRAGALGRGLPLLLAAPDAFAAQLRAIVAAGGAGLRIMIPMVASVEEFLACRRLLDKAVAGGASPPLGVMVELRAAVAHAGALAQHADFFSVGTNDLTAALLGLSRRDPALTPLRAAEPVVLQAIAETVAEANAAGIPVSVCGDAAAEPVLVPLLIGLGCDSLSVAPAALDEIRALVRGLDHRRCVRAAHAALDARSAEEVTALGAGCLS
jgi:phosphoenolpyruvate-protein kinase (PTS system EI component)